MSKYRIACRYENGDEWYYAQFKFLGLVWIDYWAIRGVYDDFGGKSMSMDPKLVEEYIENKMNGSKASHSRRKRIYKTYE